MKIGIILISDGFAGAERVVYNLADNLSKKHIVYLFLNEEILKLYKNLKNINFISLGTFYKNNKIQKHFILKKMSKKIKKIIDEEKINVLNPHMETSMIMINSKAIIPVFHNKGINQLSKSKNLIKRFYFSPKLKKVLNNSLKIIYVSKNQILNTPEKYKKKIVIIDNGVDTNTFKLLKNIKQEKKVVLFVGRYVELKGIREILAVAKQLPQYEFWFAGKGELEKEIKGSNIKNIGFQKTEDLVKLYNQATICIFPSHRDAFGLTGLEAMSCRKPVIATPKGFSEYIEDKKDGIIIPAKDENALKNAIIDLMENPKKRKMIEKNAREKALKYSWNKIADKYLKVFKDVANQK